MSNILILFNHTLTEKQELDAREMLRIQNFLYPPSEVLDLWGAIPPDCNELKPLLAPVFKWTDKAGRPDDYLLVQGDFGATLIVVEHALNSRLKPVYSTTRRNAREIRHHDGNVKLVHEFEHVRFRLYGK